MRIKIFSELDLIDAVQVDSMAQVRKIAKQYGVDVDSEKPERPAFIKLIEIKNDEEIIKWFEIEEDTGKLSPIPVEEAEELEYEFSDEILKEQGWFGKYLSEEFEELLEGRRKKQVSADGSTKKVRSRKDQKKGASRRTGLSKSARKRRARKASRTRSRGSQTQANRKRKKAMRKRRSRGL